MISNVWAETSGAGKMNAGAGLLGIAPWVFIFVIFYVLLIRPQQRQAKERKKMLDSLKRGERILTSGGFYATIVNIKGNVLDVELSDEVKVQLDRSAVTAVIKKSPVPSPDNEIQSPPLIK